MKRREIIKRITKEAKAQGVTFDIKREGGSHTVYNLGGCMIPIPRHKEISELTTRDIFIETEDALGKDWWR